MPINPKNKDAYSYYVCEGCFNTPDNCTCSMWKTETHDLLPLYLIRIDIRIQEHLQILREKGYITEFSCEGHSVYDGAQIGFFKDYNFGVDIPLPEGFKKKLIRNPSNREQVRCFIESQYCKNSSRRKSMSNEELEKIKSKHLDALLDWCKALPKWEEEFVEILPEM